ncbi:MAG: hemolysin family protein [Deltaproteobacteria bacterium]|nr:hemolysin family protein [Deltaproteobacteria bacterium]
MPTLLALSLAVLLIALNAFFVAAEFAFVKVRTTRLEVLAHAGDRRARAALFGRANLDAYLSVCQLGITLASLGLGWLGEPAVAALIRPLLEALGLGSPELVRTLAFVLGFSLITLGHVVLGELAPKIISIRAAEATALALARPMRGFHLIFWPGVKLLNSAADFIVRRLGGAASDRRDSAHSSEELKLLVAEARAVGQLDADEASFVNNIFNLDRRNARDLMVHRTRVAALSASGTVAEAMEAVQARGFTRFPVYEGERDNMVGFIHAKDLLGKNPDRPLLPLARQALSVFDQSPADEVLARMKREGRPFGLVWDEYGSWQGLITLTDLLEAIVGELKDEFDRSPPRVSPWRDGACLVDPGVSPSELAAFLPLNLGPDAPEHYHTLAALLAGRFEEAPGPSISLYGAVFTIFKRDGRAIKRFLVRMASSPAGPVHGTVK